MRLREAGLTLVETLVAMALFGVLLTILVNSLLPGLRAWRQADAHADLQQGGAVALNRLAGDLRIANPSNIALTAVSFPDPQTGDSVSTTQIQLFSPVDLRGQIQYDPSGALLWQNREVFYLDAAAGDLKEQIDAIPPAVALDPKSLPAFQPSPQDRTVAHHVYRILVTSGSAASPAASPSPGASPQDASTAYVISIDLRREGARCTLETSVTPLASP